MWDLVVGIANELKLAVRARSVHDDDHAADPPWSDWVLCPVPGFVEAMQLGPIPFGDLLWMEVRSCSVTPTGRLIPDLRVNKDAALRQALARAGIRFTDLGDRVRVERGLGTT